MKITKRQRELAKRLKKAFPDKQEQSSKIGISYTYYSNLRRLTQAVSEDMLDKVEKYLDSVGG